MQRMTYVTHVKRNNDTSGRHARLTLVRNVKFLKPLFSAENTQNVREKNVKKITFHFDINLLKHLTYSDFNETWHTTRQDCNLKYKMYIFLLS